MRVHYEEHVSDANSILKKTDGRGISAALFCAIKRCLQVALTLTSAGLDWEFVFIDFFGGSHKRRNGGRASSG